MYRNLLVNFGRLEFRYSVQCVLLNRGTLCKLFEEARGTVNRQPGYRAGNQVKSATV